MSGEKARRVCHVKRGTTYEVLGEASVQVSHGVMQSRLPHLGKHARNLVEGDRLTVYRSEADGSLWARFPDEFEDGRFEELPPVAGPHVEPHGGGVEAVRADGWQAEAEAHASALAERSGIDMLDDHGAFLADIEQTLIEFAEWTLKLAASPAPDAKGSAVVPAEVAPMSNTGDLSAALAIAAAVHDGQTDKAGRPYLAHPLCMVARALERWHSPDIAIVAALHDVVEDSAISFDDLRTQGFSELVVDAVEALTGRAGEPYGLAIARAKGNRLAHIVKLLDVEDNADPARLAKIRDSELRLRLALKYATARRDLLAGCSVCELGDVG